MNVVHLSPHFPPHFDRFATRLAWRGAKVLGITDQDPRHLGGELRQALHDHVQVPSLHDTRAVLLAVDALRRRHGRIDRVESHLETWLELEALVREAFDIPGPRPEHMARIKRKSRMKDVFRQAGVATARAALHRDLPALERLVEEAGFPLFVKPDVGVGAQDTHELPDLDSLRFFLATHPHGSYLIEEHIEGAIQTFDGLTGPDGQVLFHTSHRYSSDGRAIAARGIDHSYWNARRLDPDLEKAGLAICRVLRIPEKFFHFEFFRRPDGSLYGIELNLRPPGGFTPDMFNFAHDIDVYDLWARVLTHGQASFEYSRPYHCSHVSRRDRFRYRIPHQELLHTLGRALCMYEPMNPLYAEVMGEHAYVIRSPDQGELDRLTALIQQQA